MKITSEQIKTLRDLFTDILKSPDIKTPIMEIGANLKAEPEIIALITKLIELVIFIIKIKRL